MIRRMPMKSAYLAPEEVKVFFAALNDASIEYVLLKNIDEELPNRLIRGKDIDILVRAGELSRYFDLLARLGFSETVHPQSSRMGWVFAYGASDCFMHTNSGGLMVDVHCELCLKALEGNIWIPFERHINEAVWMTRVLDSDNGWWVLNNKIGFAYLVSRCMFDKSYFSPPYRAHIRRWAGLLDDEEVRGILRTVFFKFTPTLIEMLREERYDSIVDTYISFGDY
jgi:hypothetical protein